MTNQEGEVRKLYYMNSDFLKTEIEEYNSLQDDMHDFCDRNNISWRSEDNRIRNSVHHILSHKEVIKRIIDAGFTVKSEWIDLVNSPIEIYMKKLGD